jgi:hypothetical protein
MAGEHPNNRRHVIAFRLRRRSSRVLACSVCLRVWDGGAWMEAGEAIRRLRTFEREQVMGLDSAICDRCEAELRLRRRSGFEQLAA